MHSTLNQLDDSMDSGLFGKINDESQYSVEGFDGPKLAKATSQVSTYS